jgi:hypothetical protein
MTILDLKDCFRVDFNNTRDVRNFSAHSPTDFTKWLLKSNNPKVGSNFFLRYIGEERFKDMLAQVEEESLSEILDILLREPLADYFWYGYPEHGGKLSYSLPNHDVVPSDALRVDKEKIKVFLRDYKLEKLGI